MSIVEKAKSLLAKKEAKEQELLSTAQKVNRMIEILDLQASGVNARDHGPFALVPLYNSVIVIDDNSEAPDRLAVDKQAREKQKKYEGLDYKRLQPRDFLAFVSTGGICDGFRDGMGFAIMLGELRSGDGPNNRKIDRVLKKSGFENIKGSQMSRD